MSEFNEGDIFSWRWKDESRSYWCKSRIAVFTNGRIRDTYWSVMSEGGLNPEDVTLEFQGNPKDMTVIPKWERVFFKNEDLVDMTHPNDSGAPVYVKRGRSRSPEIMREYFSNQKSKALYASQSALRRVDECEKSLATINGGDVSGHFPIYSER